MTAADHVAHGYTLTDIDQLAKTAAAAAPATLDGYTRYQLAWSAIAEHILKAEPPNRRDLIHAGQQAINEEITACLHARGYRSGHAHNGPASSPRYVQYWHQPTDDSAIDRLIDHLAAAQIGDLFTATEGRVVEALARHADHQNAADSLGMPYQGFAARLSEARRRFRTHWFAPDTPPPSHSHDKRRGNTAPRTRCSAGHELAGDNLRIRRRKGGKTERICRACDHDRSVARYAAVRAAA